MLLKKARAQKAGHRRANDGMRAAKKIQTKLQKMDASRPALKILWTSKKNAYANRFYQQQQVQPTSGAGGGSWQSSWLAEGGEVRRRASPPAPPPLPPSGTDASNYAPF
jgi:hypothetical protein